MKAFTAEQLTALLVAERPMCQHCHRFATHCANNDVSCEEHIEKMCEVFHWKKEDVVPTLQHDLAAKMNATIWPDPKAKPKIVGVVYLIHFDKSIGNLNNKRARAQHYIGWTEDLPTRLDCHRTGNGARIMKYLKDHGIGWSLARYWKNATKRDERKIKNMKCAPALCGCCTTRPRNPPIEHLEEAFKVIDDSIL